MNINQMFQIKVLVSDSHALLSLNYLSSVLENDKILANRFYLSIMKITACSPESHFSNIISKHSVVPRSGTARLF